MTTNFNLDKTLDETYNNCPDFQFFAFDSLESPELEEECEKDYPEFEINGQIIQHDQDSGDEKLNELIFNYLKSIAGELKKQKQFHLSSTNAGQRSCPTSIKEESIKESY